MQIKNMKNAVLIRKKDVLPKIFSLATVCMLHASIAFASTSSSSRFPWRTMLTSLMEEFTGFLPLTLGAIAIGVTGILMAFGFGGQMIKTGFNIVIGVTVAIAGVTFVQLIAGDAGGLLI